MSAATKPPSTPTKSPVASTTPRPTSASSSKKTNSIGFYDLDKNLGEGNFAKVKLATHTLTKEKVINKLYNRVYLPIKFKKN